jgi:hypothetical protein
MECDLAGPHREVLNPVKKVAAATGAAAAKSLSFGPLGFAGSSFFRAARVMRPRWHCPQWPGIAVAVVVPNPGHGMWQSLFIAAFGRQVKEVVRGDQNV